MSLDLNVNRGVLNSQSARQDLETYRANKDRAQKISDRAEMALASVPVCTGIMYASPALPFVGLVLVAVLAVVAAILGEQNGGSTPRMHTSREFDYIAKPAAAVDSLVSASDSREREEAAVNAGFGLIGGTIWLGMEMGKHIYTFPVLKEALKANGAALGLFLAIRAANFGVQRHYDRKMSRIKSLDTV